MNAPPARALRALEALNFFMADIAAGVGPFLGVYLLAHGWRSGWIGTVMTFGGVAGVLATAPGGALIDATGRKRLYIALGSACTIAASAAILISQNVFLVSFSQIATALAGAVLVPAVTAVTLGVVGQGGFNRQMGRNQAYNHAGNVVGAALSGYLGWKFGLNAVFYLAAVFALLSIVSVFLIPDNAINHRVARGLAEEGEGDGVSGFSTLAKNRPLVVLAASLAFFHFGNAAMLPLYGLAVVAAKKGNPAAFTAETIVVAQTVMIAASLLLMRVRSQRGLWLALLISFASLPVRGLVAAFFIDAWGVYPVQALDGVGAGLQSVAVPALVAKVLHGTGRVNVGIGAVMTMQAVGAALSPALGGWIAQGEGYPVAFLALGGVSVVSLALWIGFGGAVRQAAAPVKERAASPASAEIRATPRRAG
jgi:MFS family permease